jgi:hypothetical protein
MRNKCLSIGPTNQIKSGRRRTVFPHSPRQESPGRHWPFATILIALPGHLDNADIPLMLAQRQKINHQTICLGFPRSPPNGIESLAWEIFQGGNGTGFVD